MERDSMRFFAGLIVCAAGGLASGQGCPTELCDPDPCGTLDLGPYSPPGVWTLEQDRRPALVIGLHNGGNNDYGLHPDWYEDVCDNGFPYQPTDSDSDGVPDVFEWLLDNMEQGYQLGYRRIILNLPAGVAESEGYLFASAQWWTMPGWKRNGFETHVADWLEDKELLGDPVTLGVYAGYQIDDPCDLSMLSSHAPDFEDSDDVCVMNQNIQPWIDIGVTEYWFDAGSSDWENMSTLQFSTDYDGVIRFGGEAVPTEGTATACSGDRAPDSDAIAASPFVSNFRYNMSRFGDDQTVNPSTTDLAVWFTGHHVDCSTSPFYGDEWEYDDVWRLCDDGWIPWMHHQFALTPRSQWTTYTDGANETTYTFDYSFRYGTEALFRFYDYGEITSVADFNGDGLIEVDTGTDTDYAAFYAAWSANINQSGGFLDGDVDGSGQVTSADFTAFNNARTQWTSYGIVTGVDLGDAPWLP